MLRPNFNLSIRELGTEKEEEQNVYTAPELAIHHVVLSPRPSISKKRSSDGTEKSPIVQPQQPKQVISYLFQTPQMPGKFNPQEAIARGVPKGPLFGQLHHGKDVVLADGTCVLSSDCVAASSPPNTVAVIACPSIDYITDLIHAPLWSKYGLDLMIHLADRDVLTHPMYMEWIEGLGKKTKIQHLIVNAPLECPQRSIFRASTKLNLKLAKVLPECFTNPKQSEYVEVSQERTSVLWKEQEIMFGVRT